MSVFDFFADLTNPLLVFLPKALMVATMASILCGVVGCFVVLRGMSFIGDAVAHSVFPGLAVAFVVGGNLVVGGAIAGIVTALLVAIFSQFRRLKEDSVIGVFFVAAFALGIVIIFAVSRLRGITHGLPVRVDYRYPHIRRLRCGYHRLCRDRGSHGFPARPCHGEH